MALYSLARSSFSPTIISFLIRDGQDQQIPVVLLKEGTTETKGRDAKRNNIAAAKQVANIVKSCLGPRGMDKLLVSSIGDATITNDGATILKELDVEHPVAKMD